MKTIHQDQDLQQFARQYEVESGLTVSMHYLKNANVYVFYKGGIMAGGFVLNERGDGNTLERFSSGYNREAAHRFIGDVSRTCELSHFWMKFECRKNVFFSSQVWLQMATTVKKSNQPYVVYGTNSDKLAELYNFPKKSVQLSKEVKDGKNAYVFMSKTKDFFWGVTDIILARMSIGYRNRSSKLDVYNKYQMRFELAG